MKIKTSHQWQTGSIHRIYFLSIIAGEFFEIILSLGGLVSSKDMIIK